METDYKETSPVRSTTHGQVRGALQKSIYDELYYTFDGIPYAQPPLGELRFKEPQDAKPWNGILDCTEPRAQCLQVNRFTKEILGSEDCLYLNIAVKKLKSDKPLPVMVYVHGGRFIAGDPTRRAWSPEFLMREDVIFISVGYRFGAFGFLSFADPSLGIPGNAGLKDIMLALKWVKANVKYFNGDENNITLAGHSSGSMLVHLLSVSPQTEGLFHKFMLLAGSMPDLIRQHDVEYQIAQKLGYQGENVDSQVYNFIKNTDPAALVTVNILKESDKVQTLFIPMCSPNVEQYETSTSILLAEPRELQRTAWTNRIPLVLGANSEDGFNVSVKFIEAYKEKPELLLPRILQSIPDSDLRRQFGRKFIEFACKVELNELSEASSDSLLKIKTALMCHLGSGLIKSRLAQGKADTYLYRFDFESPDYNFFRLRDKGPDPANRGVVHGDELAYIFKTPAAFKLDKSRGEYATICRMTAMIAEFALRSDPNAALIRSLVNWQPVSKEGPTMCLNISEKLEFIPQPEREHLEFLDRLCELAGVEL